MTKAERLIKGQFIIIAGSLKMVKRGVNYRLRMCLRLRGRIIEKAYVSLGSSPSPATKSCLLTDGAIQNYRKDGWGRLRNEGLVPESARN